MGAWFVLLALPQTPVEGIRGFLKPDAKQQVQGLSELRQACAGRNRHVFRDDPRLLKGLARLRSKVSKGSTPQRFEVLEAVMKAERCFSAAKLNGLLGPLLADRDPRVVERVTEVLATTGQPVVIPLLLEHLAQRQGACLKPGLAAAEQKVCVWLSYGPGAALHNAGPSDPVRQRVALSIRPFLEAPYAKVREVAVESLAASKDRASIDSLVKLINKEERRLFAEPNSPEMIGRFKKRLKALRRSAGGPQ